MAAIRSRSSSAVGARSSGSAAALLAATLLLGPTVSPSRASAQGDLADACAPLSSPAGVCGLAAASVRTIQPRIGTALWGGSPVPGTASTLGMRLGSFPRVSVSGRVAVVPTTLPPLLDGAENESRTAWLTGVSAQTTIGLLTGFSPLPTVGGVLSVDAIARVSVAPLPTGKGFDDGAVWGWQVGARVGALRESLTLPGVSITGAYGRTGDVAFGDPDGATTDGFWQGAVSDLSATLAASKRVGPMGFTGGVAWDRYGSDVRIGYRTTPLGPQAVVDADAETDRWSAFVNGSWTLLIFHAAAEVGWQEAPEPQGLPSGVRVDPAGWWVGAAFRVSI